MKAFFLALLLCLPAQAQDAPKAPVQEAGIPKPPGATPDIPRVAPPSLSLTNPFPPGRSMAVESGELVPFAGQLLEGSEHSRREWNNERTAGELAKLKEGQKTETVFWVAVIVGSLAVGAAIGAGVALALKKP